MKELLLTAAEQLRHVNQAVQQDIQDLIITEGLNIPTAYLEHRELYKGQYLLFKILINLNF